MPPSVLSSAVTEPLLPSAETRTASSAASSAAAAMAVEISVSRAAISVIQSSRRRRLWPSGLYLVKSRSDTQKAPWDSPAVGPDEDGSMLGRMVLALSAVVLLLGPVARRLWPRTARQQEFTHEAREEAVRKAPSCREALDVMEACAYGATGDTSLGEIVREKCEAGFLTKLSKAQRKTYDAEVKRCDAKARGGREGTMYISAAAFCRAGVARDTAAKFAKMPLRK